MLRQQADSAERRESTSLQPQSTIEGWRDRGHDDHLDGSDRDRVMAGRKPLGPRGRAPGRIAQCEGSSGADPGDDRRSNDGGGRGRALGISEAMFYKLRTRVLQVSLEDLEPKPLGRPSQVPSPETFAR